MPAKQKPIVKKKMPTVRKRRRYLYTKRTDPWPFIFAAANLSDKALRVAIALLRLGYLRRSRVVQWETEVGGQLGLHLLAGYGGLRALEAGGLVDVDWRDDGCLPIVTIVGPGKPNSKPQKERKR